MRIAGGIWRGIAIETPKGADRTRPTTDRTREAIASMLLSARGLDLSGARVLDAFAGSGALGLELLSRGAESAVFIEKHRPTAALIKRTIASCEGAGDRAEVICGDAFRLARAGVSGGPFDIVLLDPPYAFSAESVAELIELLADSGLLAEDAIVMYERASDAPELASGILSPLRSKRYGGTSVDLLVRKA